MITQSLDIMKTKPRVYVVTTQTTMCFLETDEHGFVHQLKPDTFERDGILSTNGWDLSTRYSAYGPLARSEAPSAAATGTQPPISGVNQLSIQMQTIASSLCGTLEDIAGEPVAFLLIAQVDGVAQYVSNAERAQGRQLLESLLARWDKNRADIPAHYNPDLKPGQDK